MRKYHIRIGYKQISHEYFLNHNFVRNWLYKFCFSSTCLNQVSFPWTNRLALQIQDHTFLTCLQLLALVFTNTVQVVLSTTGVLDVLNANVDALRKVAIPLAG